MDGGKEGIMVKKMYQMVALLGGGMTAATQ